MTNFYEDLKAENIYDENFLSRMKEAEEDIKNGKIKKYIAEKFISSL
jgi:hypothetical protein